MKIEIIKGHEQANSRTNNDTGKVSWSQDAYIHLGGAFPQKFTIPLESAAHAYPVGHYTLSLESFKVNQYGGLEINRWGMGLVQTAQMAKAV